MKQKSRFLIPVLALLLCLALAAAAVFAVLFFIRADTNAEAEKYKEQWRNDTDHKLYFEDGLWQNANVYMKNLTCSGKSFSFYIFNDTHYLQHFDRDNVYVQRFESNKWNDVEFSLTYAENSIPPVRYAPTFLSVECVFLKDTPNENGEYECDPNGCVSSGYYRVIVAVHSSSCADYNVVGYLPFYYE